MYIIVYKENEKERQLEVEDERLITEVLELYDVIIKILDSKDRIYDKRDLLEQEENKLVEILNDRDSKEIMKDKIQAYLDRNREYMKQERYQYLVEELNKLYETEDKIQLKLRFVNVYFKWN